MMSLKYPRYVMCSIEELMKPTSYDMGFDTQIGKSVFLTSTLLIVISDIYYDH